MCTNLYHFDPTYWPNSRHHSTFHIHLITFTPCPSRTALSTTVDGWPTKVQIHTLPRYSTSTTVDYSVLLLHCNWRHVLYAYLILYLRYRTHTSPLLVHHYITHFSITHYSSILQYSYNCTLYFFCIIGVLQYLYCTRLLRVQQQCTPCSVWYNSPLYSYCSTPVQQKMHSSTMMYKVLLL